jgi:hypothetical protein
MAAKKSKKSTYKDIKQIFNMKNDLHKKGQFLTLTINKEQYQWSTQYITGEEIRKLGKISLDDDIFLAIKKPWEDEPIPDDKQVNLARPEIEHFYSKEKCVEVIIIVNGEAKKWDKKKISFKEVIILGFGSFNENPNIVYTVAYEDGPKENIEGSMTKGTEVCVKNKMIFHATATDKS